MKIEKSYTSRKTSILITTYELCINDEEFLNRLTWDLLIVDEGHRLKNSETILYQILTKLCQGLRFILTGTPVQNNLTELYNLLHFVAPKYFKHQLRQEFVEYFKDISQNTSLGDDLSRILKPFILRRSKVQVIHDLPPRLDLLIYHNLSPLQTRLYRALLTRNVDVFSSVVAPGRQRAPAYRLNNLLLQLRKCVSHPYLFDGVEPEPFELGNHLVEASGKLRLLDLLLAHLYEPLSTTSSVLKRPAHKVLIFSQMTRMLDIIQDYLTLRNYVYERLDGSVRGEDRLSAVTGFNTDDETFVFLLSTRAGGQGLNLVAADTVILLDSDFNPQTDLQATARAHRIGQTKPVRVIRLVGRDTVEEAILSRASAKLKMTSKVLESVDVSSMVDDSNSTLSGTDDLDSLLKFGLSRLLSDLNLKEPNEASSISDSDKQEELENLQPKFSRILGPTDPVSGCWLPPPGDAADDHLNSKNTSSPTDWIHLSDMPFQREPSQADQQAALQLIEAHEASVEQEALAEEEQPTERRTRKTGHAIPVSWKPKSVLSPEELEARKLKAQEAAAARRKKATELQMKQAQLKLEKKKAKWAAVSYQSLAVFREAILEEEESDQPISGDYGWLTNGQEENEETSTNRPDIHYRVGDAAAPLLYCHDRAAPVSSDIDYKWPTIVCLTVDENGSWGHGGFFSAISRLRPEPKLAYELAGDMDDLGLGDCHLVPVAPEDTQTATIQTFGDYLISMDENTTPSYNFCGLLVAQKRTKRSESTGASPDLKLTDLERSLRALGMVCRALKHCSVHIPRLGHGTHAFTWYSVERLLRKYLVDRGKTSVYVYYFKPSAQTQMDRGSASSRPVDHNNRKRHSDATSSKGWKAGKMSRVSRHLVNLFTGKVFYLWTGSDTTDQGKLQRLIVAYDGDIADSLDCDVTHVIVPSEEEFQPGTEMAQYSSCNLVTAQWIYDCVAKGELLLEADYRAIAPSNL